MSELEQQIENRRARRDALAAAGMEVYPHAFDHDLEPSEVHRRYGELSAEELEEKGIELRVPGRVTAIRRQGKLVFADLHDGVGKLQLFLRKNDLDEDGWRLVQHLDLGDIVGAAGTLMRTRLGELSLRPARLTLLAKALRPLPEKHHGLKDVEARYRQRYLDLATNPESRRVFEIRARLVRGIRRFLDRRGFLEVETPMMQTIAGGANARPFRTHHNALDVDLYLRIAPELYLKRLLVGGMPRVYEINRNFRNEGISTQHNPEFTMLELYWAYVDYRRLMALTEELLVGLAEAIHGRPELRWKGRRLDLTPPWRRLTIRQALVELGGVAEAALADAESLAAELRRRRLELPAARDYGHLLMALFEGTVEDRLEQPTFITEYPTSVSPLAKQKPGEPDVTERFELYLGGMELANAFSELNDPDVQAERFRQQLAARAAGDQEAHAFDHDYVRALEHGMPPAAGEGLGIDRLTMLFTDRHSIRDVILFPLLRPAADAAPAGEGDEL
ncbi:MAG: lysine--tRNA ligase [Acidobacteria bacterium]|nr:MAG: lysine--tRNA ligase [Acidobacteriota bacterium]